MGGRGTQRPRMGDACLSGRQGWVIHLWGAASTFSRFNFFFFEWGPEDTGKKKRLVNGSGLTGHKISKKSNGSPDCVLCLDSHQKEPSASIYKINCVEITLI